MVLKFHAKVVIPQVIFCWCR